MLSHDASQAFDIVLERIVVTSHIHHCDSKLSLSFYRMSVAANITMITRRCVYSSLLGSISEGLCTMCYMVICQPGITLDK